MVSLTIYYSYVILGAIWSILLALIWLYKTFAIDSFMCLKMCRRIKNKKKSAIKIKLENRSKRYMVDSFEITSIFLSNASSAMFLSYWSFTNQVEYLLLSCLFFAMSMIYFVAAFFRKLAALHSNRTSVEAQTHVDHYDKHLWRYQLLLFIDTLWFCVCVTYIFGVGTTINEVFNNVNRPVFCL